jgi:hypothetical protein
MFTTPITILSGQAGSGKDTVAGFMVKNHGAIAIAQADPMKALAKVIFAFTDDQLWGPSQSRNAPDPRYDYADSWFNAKAHFSQSYYPQNWVKDLLGEHVDVYEQVKQLERWFDDVYKATVGQGKQLTPRLVLQTLGTEWGRRQGDRDMWSNYALKIARALLGGGWKYNRECGLVPAPDAIGPERVVITDGRFRNELINVRMMGGTTVRIDNPHVDSSAVEKAGVAGHASEKEQKSIPPHFYTHFLFNDKSKGLAEVEERVAALIKIINRNGFWVGYEPDWDPYDDATA